MLHSLSSRHSRRAYDTALDEFMIWFQSEPQRILCKATVLHYKAELESRGLAASTVNLRLSAIRRFVAEAADNKLIAPRSS